MLKNVSFVYRTLKLTCYIPFSHCTMRCSLWWSTFFELLSYKWVSQDWLRVNCDIYGNTSGIKEGRQTVPFFPKEIRMYCDTFYDIFLRIFFCHEFIHTFIHLRVHMFIYTLMHIVHTCIIKEGKGNTYVNVFYLKNSFATNNYIFSIHLLCIFNTFYAQFLTCCLHRIVLVTSRLDKDFMFS